MYLTKRSAIKLVIILGIVDLFADMTYEGARSISGQFLAQLGASGIVVGVAAGFGEMIGYGFRLISGYISDRTGKYWLVTFIGYIFNLLAVPLLAWAGNWQIAVALMIVERFGKALRAPSKDAILSYATKETGRGWGFGLHEAMDQIGAVLGPLLMSAILYFQGGYRLGFGVLLIPALMALSFLAIACLLYPRPHELEIAHPNLEGKGFNRKFWIYLAAASCVAAGYVDFPLMAFHFEKESFMHEAWVPLFFSLAMAFAGLTALVLGPLYDRKGIGVLMGATAVSAFFAPLAFGGGLYFALAGIMLWGLGLGAQESIMRAVVADLVPMKKRGTAYGLLNIWFGIAWFLGSALMGYLYDVSLPALIVFSVGMQLIAIPLINFSNNRVKIK